MDVLKTLCKIYKVFKAFHDYKCMHAVLSFACSHQAPLPARTGLLYLLAPGSFTCSHQAPLPARTRLLYLLAPGSFTLRGCGMDG